MSDTLAVYGGARVIGGNKIFIKSADEINSLDQGIPMRVPIRPTHLLRDDLFNGVTPPIKGLSRTALTRYSEEAELYSEEPLLQKTIITHSHLDHTGGISRLHEKTIICSSPVTYKILGIMEEVNYRTDWTNDTLRLREIPRPKRQIFFGFALKPPKTPIVGIPYEKSKPERLEEGEPRPWEVGYKFHTDSTDIKLYPVDHSIPANLVHTQTSELTYAYSGDQREGELTEHAIDRISGDVDVWISEVTRGSEYKNKNHSLKGRNEVEEELFKKFSIGDGNRPNIVMQSRNDVPTFQAIKKAYERLGKQVLVSPELAYFMYRMEDVFPGVSSGLGVWRRQRDDLVSIEDEFDKEQRMWKKIVARNFTVYTDKEVVDMGSQKGIVINDTERDHAKFIDWNPFGATFVDTTSEHRDESEKVSNDYFRVMLNRLNIKYQRAHASGHQTVEYAIDVAKRVDAPVILLVHLSSDNDKTTGLPFYEICRRLFEKETCKKILVPERGIVYDLERDSFPFISKAPMIPMVYRSFRPPKPILNINPKLPKDANSPHKKKMRRMAKKSNAMKLDNFTGS